MNARVVVNLIIVVGSICFGFFPLDRKRIRARWAKGIFVLIGLIGCAMGAVRVALEMHWLQLSDHNDYVIHTMLSEVGGLLLGFIFSLILSGQLLGTKLVTA